MTFLETSMLTPYLQNREIEVSSSSSTHFIAKREDLPSLECVPSCLRDDLDLDSFGGLSLELSTWVCDSRVIDRFKSFDLRRGRGRGGESIAESSVPL